MFKLKSAIGKIIKMDNLISEPIKIESFRSSWKVLNVVGKIQFDISLRKKCPTEKELTNIALYRS